MSDGRSLATRIRQRSHSAKQDMYYRLGIRTRGYSKAFLKAAEKLDAQTKLFYQRGRIAKASIMHLFAPNNTRVVAPESVLKARVIRANGEVEDLGVLSTKVITDAFVNYVVDELQASSGGIAGFRYHGAGISSTAENQTQTALGSEVDSRAIGTQSEGAAQNIYRSIGVVSFGASYAIVEHGLFRGASGEVMMDRSVFPAINVGSGDSIEFTYELTLPAGT